jgi:hypothetical protein
MSARIITPRQPASVLFLLSSLNEDRGKKKKAHRPFLVVIAMASLSFGGR